MWTWNVQGWAYTYGIVDYAGECLPSLVEHACSTNVI